MLKRNKKITLLVLVLSVVSIFTVFTIVANACSKSFSIFFNGARNTVIIKIHPTQNATLTTMPGTTATPVTSTSSVTAMPTPIDNKGNSSVKIKTIDSYTIFTPAKLGENGKKHPIITWGNGTSATPTNYTGLLNALAKNGFVVVASNSTTTGTGTEMIGGIDLMISENSKSESFFNGKLDTNAIGAAGQSQGGSGAIITGKDTRVKCIELIMPTQTPPTGVNCPMFIITGSSDTIINSALVKSTIYDPSTLPTVFAELQGATHFGSIGPSPSTDIVNYSVKWFKVYLNGDSSLKSTFFGTDSSIAKDTKWKAESKN